LRLVGALVRLVEIHGPSIATHGLARELVAHGALGEIRPAIELGEVVASLPPSLRAQVHLEVSAESFRLQVPTSPGS
jgi:hypothetical protein